MRSLSLLLILSGAVLLAACGDEDSNEATKGKPFEEPLTLEQVYGRVAEAITRPDKLYHAVLETDSKVGETSNSGKQEYWVDAGRDLARVERSSGGTKDTRIATGGAMYNSGPAVANRRANKVPADLCHGANSAVSMLLQCQGENETSSKAEFGRYRDHDAAVIVRDVVISGEDQTIKYTQRVYVDRDTHLPLGIEDKGTYESEKVDPLTALGDHDGDFVSADSLTQDFFDPVSIGYVKAEPLEPLNRPDLGITVYWLGETFSPGGGLPDLAVASVEVPCDEPTSPKRTCGPGEKFILYYRAAADEFGPPLLGIQEWTAADWDAAQLQGDFSRSELCAFPKS